MPNPRRPAQGEANADQKIQGVDMTNYYATMYQGMIADWRERKGMGDFAHMTVQLPPSQAAAADPAKGAAGSTGRPQIRLAEALTAPHSGGLTDISGVAVSLDCGGKSAWGWDHPPNKNEIARRLALQTVHAAYAQQGRIPGAFVCPPPDSIEVSGAGNETFNGVYHRRGKMSDSAPVFELDASHQLWRLAGSWHLGYMGRHVHYSRRGSVGPRHIATGWTSAPPATMGLPPFPTLTIGGTHPPCNDTSLWTGPLLEGVEQHGTTVMLNFKNWSAEGLQLQDVKSTNPDGTTNNCTRCCKGFPPFELQEVGGKWVRPPLSAVKLSGDTVTVEGPLGGHAARRVRYAWADYVDCVLVNGDGLPAGPFVVNISAAAAAAAAERRSTVHTALAQLQEQSKEEEQGPPPMPNSALSPPMGFNSCTLLSPRAKTNQIFCAGCDGVFVHAMCLLTHMRPVTGNFYHCNIDENTVKAVLDAIASNGMKEAGYK
jgi:hypothetical protein